MDIKQDVWENVVGYMKIEATKDKQARKTDQKSKGNIQGDTAIIDNE